jgi:hypothetical protein
MVPVAVQKISALYVTLGLITVFTHVHHDFASWHKQTHSKPHQNYILKKSISTNVSQVVSFFHVFCPKFCRHSHLYATWPTHIILLELIPLLHNIPNCYNMKNHVNSPDGVWKLTQHMFSFLGNENWHIIKFFCTHKHKTLTILSLTAGNISSALCSRILGIPVARECRIFHNLKTSFYHTFCGLQVNWHTRIPVIQHHISNKCTSI